MAKRIYTQAQRDAANARKRAKYATKSKDEIIAENKKRASYRHDRYVRLQAVKTQDEIDAENAAKRAKIANRTPEQIEADKVKSKAKRDSPEQKEHAHEYYEGWYYNRTPEEIEEDKQKAAVRWSTMATEKKAHKIDLALKWNAENPAKVRARQKRYSRSVKGALKKLKRNALKNKNKVLLSDAEIIALMKQPCHYCGEQDDVMCNNLDRLEPTIREYSRNNCLPCCSVCNISKHTYGYYEFLQFVYDIWLHHFDVDYFALHRRRKRKPNYKQFCNNALSREIKMELTREEYLSLVGQDCHYCGAKQAGGVDRRDPAVHYWRPNCVPCCGPCNFMKYTKTDKEFFDWVTKIMTHLML